MCRLVRDELCVSSLPRGVCCNLCLLFLCCVHKLLSPVWSVFLCGALCGELSCVDYFSCVERIPVWSSKYICCVQNSVPVWNENLCWRMKIFHFDWGSVVSLWSWIWNGDCCNWNGECSFCNEAEGDASTKTSGDVLKIIFVMMSEVSVSALRCAIGLGVEL